MQISFQSNDTKYWKVHTRIYLQHIRKYEDMVSLPMTELITRDKMPKILTSLCQRTAFDNEESQYRIVSFNRHRNDKCETIHTKHLHTRFVYKTINENKDDIHIKRKLMFLSIEPSPHLEQRWNSTIE